MNKILSLLFSRISLVSFTLLALSVLYAYTTLGMPSLKSIRVSNAQYKPSYLPTAIFVGGTSGIGQGMAQRFANHTQGNSNIVLVGRNRQAAEQIIASLPKPASSDTRHEFVPCDLTLMENVERATAEIKSRYSKINFLIMSPGFMTTKGRDETKEGIDRKLAVHYYGRWKFLDGLISLLDRAQKDGEDAKVLTVLAAGHGSELDLSDLGLKKTYSVTKAALQAPTYNDMMIEAFALKYPEISFNHAAPGGVKTNLFKNAETATVRFFSSLEFLLSPLVVSIDDCGEYLWHGLYNATKGAHRLNRHGEDIGKWRYYGSDEARQKLWDHTVEATTAKP